MLGNLQNLIRKAEEKLSLNLVDEGMVYVNEAVRVGARPENFMQLIVKYFNNKQFGIAATLARALVIRYNSNYHLLNTYGVILKNLKDYNAAIVVLKKAIEVNTADPMAWINLGNIFMIQIEHENALSCYIQASKLDPKHLEAMRLQASAYIKLGKSNMAEAILRKAIMINPKDVAIMSDLSAACYNQQEYEQADNYIDNCLKLSPQDVNVLKRKALIMKQLGKASESIPILEDIRNRFPEDVDNLLDLGHAYNTVMGDSIKAKRFYDMAYKVDPDNVEVLKRLCEFLFSIKKYDGSQDEFISQAYIYFNKLMEKSGPTKENAAIIQYITLKLLDFETYDKLGPYQELVKYWMGKHDSRPLIMMLSRVKTLEDRKILLEAHRVCGEMLEERAQKKSLSRPVRKRTNGKIRIGIMSSDLRQHPVGFFVWPLIEHLDRNKFEIYCYSFFPYEVDEVQKKIMSRVNSFKNYLEESDFLIGQSIANDQVDVLFELGGRTLFNRTDSCIYRPAPIQISWLGYPHSIGFPTSIDYILVDPYINPSKDNLLLEKPFIMPETWVSIDKVGFLDLYINKTIPQDRNGFITFGTTNAVHKITPEAIETWAAIMNSVPESKFLYVRPETDSKILQHNFRRHMARYGITGDRIDFRATHTDHLKYYNEIDIALDTFPHTGGTTTCESLWMGVPVVTLVGDSFFERLSYSNLTNAGLGKLCSFSKEGYINITLGLVGDIEQRRYLRNNMRKQIAENPLGRSIQFSDNFAMKVSDLVGVSYNAAV
jgi:predicted O-linked N-acetylglucosamine transferase (SPINDLY family)